MFGIAMTLRIAVETSATLRVLFMISGVLMLGRGAVTKDGPIHVGAKVFTANSAVRGALNVGTPLGGDSGAVLPKPYRALGYTKNLSKLGAVADTASRNGDGAFCLVHGESIDYLYPRGKQDLDSSCGSFAYPSRMEDANKRDALGPVAKYVKDARKKAGMTLEKLGSELSCGKQNVWSWENGRHDPSPEQLARIAIVTNVSLPEELSPSVGYKAETKTLDAARSGVASDVAEAIRLSIQAIAERWGVEDARDLLDPSEEAVARVERAISLAFVSKSDTRHSNRVTKATDTPSTTRDNAEGPRDARWEQDNKKTAANGNNGGSGGTT